MDTRKPRRRGLSRREVIKTAAVGAVASVGPFFHVNSARAAKTLKIIQWSHFVPGYDKWFNNEYTKDGGKKNDTEVIVDNINLALPESRAAAEVSAQKGHDLFFFLLPPSVFEEQVVPMNDVYAECEKKHGKPIDTAVAMRAIMYSFGSHEQDAEGNLTINSPQTLEALKFVKALFEETMTPEVLAWDASSNNRQMLAGRSSLVLNAISVTRAAENNKMPIHEKIGLAKAAKGPVRRIGLEHVMDCYVIWKFSENIPGAQKFLVDYIDNFKQAFMASEFYNFPCFAKTVPDLKQLLAKDTKAVPDNKYAVLEDVLDWATNIGYPGYSTAAISDTYQTWLLNTMFAECATSAETPEDALKRADAKMKAIWAKWKERNLI